MIDGRIIWLFKNAASLYFCKCQLSFLYGPSSRLTHLFNFLKTREYHQAWFLQLCLFLLGSKSWNSMNMTMARVRSSHLSIKCNISWVFIVVSFRTTLDNALASIYGIFRVLETRYFKMCINFWNAISHISPEECFLSEYVTISRP